MLPLVVLHLHRHLEQEEQREQQQQEQRWPLASPAVLARRPLLLRLMPFRRPSGTAAAGRKQTLCVLA